ncbi:MAG: membrane protein insertase YidC [Gammaproteobacteria bacterium]
MDTKRFLLFVALGLVSLMLWQNWQQEYASPAQTGRTTSAPSSGDDNTDAAPAEPDRSIPELPAETADGRSEPEIVASSPAESAEQIRVQTDVYELAISTAGGDIREAKLLEYPVSVKSPDDPYVLLTDARPLLYVAQGGLLSEQPAPTHKSVYQAEQSEYVLDENESSLEVRLRWSDSNGLAVDKVYRFERGSYAIDVRYEVSNNSSSDWRGWAYGQLLRNDPDGGGARLIYTYTGAALSSPDNRYDKISFDDMRDKKLERRTVDGWAAMLHHYFVTALIPANRDDEYRYYSLVVNRNTPDEAYAIGATTPAQTVAAGEQKVLEHRLYIGPKLQHVLEDLAPSLELTVDYGYLWFIAKPLFWILEKIHDLVGNWGWSIILLTILIKLVFYRLSAAGYRSMAKMRRVQPRLLAVRERYANDKQRLNQAMMDLYKTEKINPLGGCFPILVQIPVFIALYWVLLESVELRQAPFILWLNDLSIPDPYFVLPLVMGVTMFIQQKLNPAPLDPVQEKIMTALPIVFTVFFAFFPAGLVLYWVVNNVLSILQQWMITRNLEANPA